jgi:hypothetical protein
VSTTPFPQKSTGKIEIAFESVEEASKIFSVHGKTASPKKAQKPKNQPNTQKKNGASSPNAPISDDPVPSNRTLVSVEDLLAADPGSPICSYFSSWKRIC